MEKVIYSNFNYLGTIDNLYLSTTGTLTACYIIDTPPIYTLSSIDYDTIYANFKASFDSLKEDTILVHKQDIYIRKKFDTEKIQGDSFLAQAKMKRFEDAECMEHRSFLMFSINNLSSLERSYITNPHKFDKALHVSDQKRYIDFKKKLKAFVANLGKIANFSVKEATETDIKECIFNYYTMFGEGAIIRDFWTHEDYLTNGKKKVCGYALTDENQLPDSIELYSKDRLFKHAIQTNEEDDINFLQTMFCENLGITLHYSHVINQVWKFDKKFISDFEVTVSKTKRYRNFSKDLQLAAPMQEKLLEEIKKGKSVLCEYSFNLLIVEDNDLFVEAKERTEELIDRILPKMYQPTGEGLGNLFFGNMIGYENKLNSSFFFLTHLEASLCTSVFGSHQKSDERGVIFNERNCNTPIVVDLWNKPFGETIKARNGIIVSSTGGGKSVLALNIMRQHIEQGTKVIVLEIGRSFELLTNIYKDNSLHIEYNENTNIGFNPFKLKDGQDKPTIGQIDQICDLVTRFLQHSSKNIDKQAEKNTIEDLLMHYYSSVRNEHSFDSFFHYIKKEKETLELTISKEYFNIERFLLVCRDFITGGRYENLSKEGDVSFLEKDLIVIELSDIKDNPFLFGYFMYILTMLMDNILMDRGIKSLLFIDEYAEVQDKKATDTDSFNIHATVAYCYQKLRKENSACYIAIQHAEQLKDDNYTKTIMTQADLLFIPQTGRDIYKQVKNAFNIESEKTLNQMYSMSSNFVKDQGLNGIEDSYSEVLVLVSKNSPHVVRLVLSKEEFLCFQTEGDINSLIKKELKSGKELKDIVEKMIHDNIEITSGTQEQEEHEL